ARRVRLRVVAVRLRDRLAVVAGGDHALRGLGAEPGNQLAGCVRVLHQALAGRRRDTVRELDRADRVQLRTRASTRQLVGDAADAVVGYRLDVAQLVVAEPHGEQVLLRYPVADVPGDVEVLRCDMELGLLIPQLWVLAETGGQPHHQLARDLGGNGDERDVRADAQVADVRAQVVTGADLAQQRVGHGAAVVRRARSVGLRPRRRTTVELRQVVPEPARPALGVRGEQEPETAVGEPGVERFFHIGDTGVTHRLGGGQGTQRRVRRLLADDDRAPEVADRVVGAAARCHRAGRRVHLVTERVRVVDLPHLGAARPGEVADRAVEV